MPNISLIAAIGARTRALGKDNDLLWKIKEDMARFTRLTTGHPVIMGRRTWESLPAKYRPLPNRSNLVISSNAGYAAPGAVVCADLPIALLCAEEMPGADEIFIGGGQSVYEPALARATRLYLTLVDDDRGGDVHFPPYDEFSKVIEREEHESDGYRYTFLTLERE